jgi:hypothetical protein
MGAGSDRVKGTAAAGKATRKSGGGSIKIDENQKKL